MTSSRLDAPALRRAAPSLPADARFCLGYSGGLDSTVLLHALVEAGVAPLQAVHVHHGLQDSAERWVAHCTHVCGALKVPLHVQRVNVPANSGVGPEAVAREARYTAFRERMQRGDCLVTAHHRDDQAETMLLHLLRGTGLTGLAGMRPLTPFPPGQLWRPLLGLPRTALRAWALERGLDWVEDPQNRERRFRRVWLRQVLLPRLEAEFPQASAKLARTAELVAGDAQLLSEVAAEDLARLDQPHTGVLDIPGLTALSPPRRHNLVRGWLRRRGLGVPSAAVLERLDAELLGAAADAQPLLRFPGCEMRRYRAGLYADAPLPPAPSPNLSLRWDTEDALELPPGCGRLFADSPPPEAILVTFPRGGERLRVAGSVHARTLKNLFQEAGVPPWRRRRTPLVAHNGALAWVGGLAESATWQAWCRVHDWDLTWRSPWSSNRA